MSQTQAELVVGQSDPQSVVLPETREIIMAPPEVCFPMSHREWKRLRKRIGEMTDPLDNAENLASICVGVVVGSALQLITWVPAYWQLPPSSQPGFAWVAPLFLVLALAAGVLAKYLYGVEARVQKISKRDAAVIAEDMDAMYERYMLKESGTTLKPPAPPQSQP
jgi:hypothetical protein